MSVLSTRQVTTVDLDRCYDIETSAYAGEEAASKEKILKRIKTYPEGFIVLEEAGEVVGFINCGATDQVELSDEEFKELIGHDPSGKYIVIMSVVVHPDKQKKGYAGMLLGDFISRMKCLGKSEVHLICQTELIALYAKYGFVYIGLSNSQHGGLSWNEMILKL